MQKKVMALCLRVQCFWPSLYILVGVVCFALSFSLYQYPAKSLLKTPPLLGGAISKPMTLPFALAFRMINE